MKHYISIKGGSWFDQAIDCRPELRFINGIVFRNNYVSFRLIKKPKQ